MVNHMICRLSHELAHDTVDAGIAFNSHNLRLSWSLTTAVLETLDQLTHEERRIDSYLTHEHFSLQLRSQALEPARH